MTTAHPAWEDLYAWDQPDPGVIFPLRDVRDVQRLGHLYPVLHGRPLDAVLRHARKLGAKSVVVETRYIDPDYRSEYTAFYSKTFSSVSDTAHRLHFFATAIEEGHPLGDLPEAKDAGYIGYCVIRPNTISRVSRTMLPPLPDDRAAVRCVISQTVHVFGQPFQIEGAVPFLQQDALLGRCAHVAAWICHAMLAAKDQLRVLPVAAFSLAADPSLSHARQLPSQGLTDAQTMQILRSSGVSPTAYLVKELNGDAQEYRLPVWARDKRYLNPSYRHPEHPMMRALCRYLDSGIPVLVNVDEHSFVVLGYRRVADDELGERVEFIRHDDARGPYKWVDDPLADPVGRRDSEQAWRSMIVPLPEKLWLPAASAEAAGGRGLREVAHEKAQGGSPQAAAFLAALDRHEVELRTFAITSTAFKKAALGRLPIEVVRAYRMLRCPRYVWVTEAILRDQRHQPKCVVGEVVLDATSGEFAPNLLAVHIPGHVLWQQTDGSTDSHLPPETPYASAGVGPVLGVANDQQPGRDGGDA